MSPLQITDSSPFGPTYSHFRFQPKRSGPTNTFGSYRSYRLSLQSHRHYPFQPQRHLLNAITKGSLTAPQGIPNDSQVLSKGLMRACKWLPKGLYHGSPKFLRAHKRASGYLPQCPPDSSQRLPEVSPMSPTEGSPFPHGLSQGRFEVSLKGYR